MWYRTYQWPLLPTRFNLNPNVHPPFHPFISIFRLRCSTCPILWGRQYRAMPNTGSPCIYVLWISGIQTTFNDIRLHTFRPCLPRPSLYLVPGIGKFVIDLRQLGPGPLHIAIPPESQTGTDRCKILMAKFL